MQPVLFTIASQPISSFGLFLLLSFLVSSFIIWRIIRVYELNEEKVLDLILLTFAMGFIFARLYFVAFHLDQFDNLNKILLINKHPGLSFWGGFWGGLLMLYFLSRRLKAHFWQMADIGIIGLFIGLAISSVGCLLGGCESGLVSTSRFAISQVGLIGKRFPLQIIQSAFFAVGFLYLWRSALRFHFAGQILSTGLVLFGIVKLVLEPFRGDTQKLFGFLNLGYLFAIASIILGIRLYYKQSKRSFIKDIQILPNLVLDSRIRQLMVLKLQRNWYNLKVNLKVGSSRWRRNILKFLNIKSNPSDFR